MVESVKLNSPNQKKPQKNGTCHLWWKNEESVSWEGVGENHPKAINIPEPEPKKSPLKNRPSQK